MNLEHFKGASKIVLNKQNILRSHSNVASKFALSTTPFGLLLKIYVNIISYILSTCLRRRDSFRNFQENLIQCFPQANFVLIDLVSKLAICA